MMFTVATALLSENVNILKIVVFQKLPIKAF